VDKGKLASMRTVDAEEKKKGLLGKDDLCKGWSGKGRPCRIGKTGKDECLDDRWSRRREE